MKKLIAVICCLFLTAAANADKVKDVNVVNQPTVRAEIVNSEPIAVSLEGSEREPFAKTVSKTYDGVFGSQDIIALAEIPPNKRLVVESVSWFLNLPADDTAFYVELEYVTEAGVAYIYPALANPRIDDSDPLISARKYHTNYELVRLYLTDLSSLEFSVYRQGLGSATTASFVATITGYLVTESS